jgi:site-specific recombinase XerD
MKLKEYFESFISHKKGDGLTDHTIREHRRFLTCLEPIGEKELYELKKTDSVLVKIEGRKHGRFGEQRAICLLRIFLQYMEDEGHQLPFKWERLEVPYVRENDQYHLKPAEFEDFVAKMPDTFYGLRDRLLYELLWSTGLRIGEALAIEMKDINFEDREIFVHTEKGGEGDTVYISDRLEQWMRKYLEKKKAQEAIYNPCSHLFVNFWLGDIKKLDKINARKNLLNYRKQFGIIKKLDHPSFRRGFATNIIEQGAHIKEVQYLCRHVSERTTLRAYVKYDKFKVRNVHNRIYSQEPKNYVLETLLKSVGNHSQDE